MRSIHPSAIIHSSAQLGDNITIGPYAIVEKDVVIQNSCILEAHTILHAGTHLGENVHIHSFAAIGGLPQDIHFDVNTPSFVRIGSHTTIREGVTIHRATQSNQATTIGENCLLMASCHVGHDSIVNNHVILTNNVLLAGHVHVEPYVIIGGAVCIHQFVRIGESAMLSGFCAFSKDIPPFSIAGGERNRLAGLNLIGLRRRGFSQDTIRDIKNCYQAIFQSPSTLYAQKALELENNHFAKTPQGQHFIQFFKNTSKRPILTPKISH